MNAPANATVPPDGLRDVVLVHGLWVPAWVMSPLGARLARTGWRVHTFGYRGRGLPLASHVERLRRFAAQVAPRGAHFVGHSLGGLVILNALEQHPRVAAGRVVLLGTPARGSLAGRRLARQGWGRWLLGESNPLWREREAPHWTRAEDLGVIAGTLSIGLGRIVGRLPGPNDGVVRVEETAIEGMREQLVLPVGHSAMLVSARVARATSDFLERGRFAPA